MRKLLDYNSIAEALRLNAGEWAILRTDSHNRVYALLSMWRRRPPKALSGRFEFRALTCGYGTGRTRLVARHAPITFPLDTDAEASASI